MNIRTAIMKAADSTEQNPDMFDFHSIYRPDCDTPGCALGWIGYHLGRKGNGKNLINQIAYAIGIGDGTDQSQFAFYNLMEDICNRSYFSDWTANEIAEGLRLFADKCHQEQDHIPASIRAIFTEQVAA